MTTCNKWDLYEISPKSMEFPGVANHNHSKHWASGCCGMRIDRLSSPTVAPEDSFIGVRVYVDGHVGDAGPQNNVVNLTTKNGPIGLVLTKVVLTKYGRTNPDFGCGGDSDDDDWNEEGDD